MLNHKQCDAFLAVAETGSFDLAASRLCITASAITLRVQSLEKNLGHMLIVRERPCRVTKAGQSLLHYLQHSRLLEHRLMQDLTGLSATTFYQVNIATNADSLATWLLPLLKPTLIEHKIVVHFQVDDQSKTHHLMQVGLVNACISTESNAMKGCVAQLLGQMTYRMVATPEFIKQWFHQGFNREAFRCAPAIIYNNKDHLHRDIMLQQFGLTCESYPHYYIPSSHAFAEAIFLGLGFGLVPDYQIAERIHMGELVEILPEARCNLHLYWHHWKQQSEILNTLSDVLFRQAGQVMNTFKY